MILEFVRRNNPRVDAWSIIYKAQHVGYIVRSLDQFLVIRKMADAEGDPVLDVRTRTSSYKEATDFIRSAISRASEQRALDGTI